MMIKSKFAKLNELGSLMVEAMAMLALISMVTPILYRKAAERTTELQDINSASQMRSVVKSIDDYVKDNYDDLVKGNSITNSAGSAQNYSALGTANGKVTVPINHFRDYLPYGFLDASGNAQETKTFTKSYKVVLKKVDATVGGKNKKTITAFIVAEPKEGDKFPLLRASRIASMIGSNGGYAEKVGGNVKANGVQGIWSIANMNTELGVTTNNGAIVASSVQPIASAGGGGESDNYLYRNYRAGKPELNRMETDLFMGGYGSTDHNIRNVNQLIITATQQAQFADTTQGVKGALMVKGGGGAFIEGTLAAMNGMFGVDSTGMKYGALFSVDSANLKYGTNGNVITASASNLNLLNGTIKVDGTGTTIASKTDITGITTIGTTGTAQTTGNQLLVKGNAEVTDTLTANKINTKTFNALTLNAGATSYSSPTWNLHVEETKASLAKADFTVATDKLKITSSESSMKNASVIMNANDVGKLTLGASGADLSSTNNTYVHGNTSAHLYTGTSAPSATANEVSIQDTMLRANRGTIAINSIVNSFTIKNTDASKMVQADIAGAVNRVRNMNLQVENPSNTSVFTVNPKTTGSETVDANVAAFDVKSAGVVIDSTAANSNRNITVKTGGVSGANASAYTYIGQGRVDVKDATGNKVVVLDAENTDKATANRGSVYVRKGVIELESPYASQITDTVATGGAAVANDKGYVRADRFVSNRGWTNPMTTVVGSFNRGATYDAYQVNPAYTSVMHDIKLTSRGGARLSDILPDFINKGIYVVDNTYLETFGSWENTSGCPSKTSGASCQTVSAAYVANNHTDWTSPWLGVVPAPQCPPGYAKVITIMPAGFAMAQAGIPGTQIPGKKQDIVIVNYPKNPNADYSANPSQAPTPLYFQKSTWLRAKVYTHGSDDTFKGWSAIMGFMYPYTYYKQYMDDLHLGLSGSDAIAWNLFPVFRKQLEAYATVYCYFDRKGGLGTKFDANLVDTTYDQLSNFRAPMSGKSPSASGSDSGYTSRLNDPNLKYTEPW